MRETRFGTVPTSPLSGETLLAEWREELLEKLLRVFTVVAIIALVPGVYAAISTGSAPILFVDLTAYLAVVPAYLLRRRHQTLSAAIVVILHLAVGGTLLFTVGPFGASMIWLLAPVLLASLLFGRGGTIAVFAVGLVLQILAAVFLYYERLPWQIPIAGWIAIVGSYVVISGVMTFAARFLMERLVNGLARERTLSAELDHRVKNNLQFMASMVLLERQTGDSPDTQFHLERIASRLTAVSGAFRLMKRGRGTLEVPFHDLIDFLVHENTQIDGMSHFVEGDQWRAPPTISIDTAVPVAVIITEILRAVALQGPQQVHVRVEQPSGVHVTIEIMVTGTNSLATPIIQDVLSRNIITALVAQTGSTLRERADGDHARLTLEIPTAET